MRYRTSRLLGGAKTKIAHISASLVLVLASLSGALPLLFTQGALAATPTDAYVSTTGSGTACTHAAPCGTFANALAVATDGGTVHVANGTYTESFTVPSGVTIKSDHGKRYTKIDGEITVAHNNVTIHGFTITNPTGTAGILIDNVDGATIRDNAFENIGDTFLGTSAVQAVYVLDTSSNISIDHNTFANIGTVSNTSSNKAIYVGDSNNGPSNNITISHNIINGVVGNPAAWPVGHGAYGLLVNHSTTGLVVSYNSISNLNGLWAHAVGLEANTPGAVISHNSVRYLTDHKGDTDSVAYRFESNPGALTTTMTSDAFNLHHASNSTDVVAVDSTWRGLDSDVAGNTYPEVFFHGRYYYYGINAFSTIEAGMAHVSVDGTVLVAPGTYDNVQANGTYQDNITVKGYSGAIINGLDLTGSTFDGLTFQGFRFIGDANGYGNDTVAIHGDGIYANLEFTRDIFDGQSQANRGAIFLNRGFDGFSLVNNSFINYDGATYGNYSAYSVVFAEAQGPAWGKNFTATRNTLRRSTFINFLETYRWKAVSYTDNNVNAIGGRLLVWSDDQYGPQEPLGPVVISGNTIKVRQGAGIELYNTSGTNAVIQDNSITGGNRCMELNSVSDSIVTGNTFNNCSSAGIKFAQDDVTAPNSASISGNTFENGPVGVENDTTSFVLDACDNTFTNITTNLYSHPGPFNTIACEAAPTLLAPANGAVVNGASVTNSWTAVPGAVKYEYQSFNSSDTTQKPRWDHYYKATSKTARDVKDGTVFYWRVRGVDANGVTSPWSDLWKVTVDNTAPVVTVATLSTTDATPTLTLRGTVSDANLAGGTVNVMVNGQTYATTIGSTQNIDGSFPWTATVTNALPVGTYSIVAFATDAAGNVGTAVAQLIITAVAPSNNSTTTSTHTAVLGASTINPQSSTGGQVLGASTITPSSSSPSSSNSSSSSSKNQASTNTPKKSPSKTSTKPKAFLWLGWWWLAVLAAILAIVWFFAGQKADNEK